MSRSMPFCSTSRLISPKTGILSSTGSDSFLCNADLLSCFLVSDVSAILLADIRVGFRVPLIEINAVNDAA